MVNVPKIPVQIPASKKLSALEILQYAVLASVLLYFGKTLFIPLSFSLLISFILYPVCKWMEKKGINKSFAILLSILGIILLFGAIIYLLFLQVVEFLNDWPLFRVKLWETATQLSVYLGERFDLSTDKQLLFVENIAKNSGSQTLSLLQNTLYSVSESAFYFLIIPVYSVFILHYRQLLVNVLYHIFSSEKKEIIQEILIETIHTYYNFIKGMLMVYLIVGILNSVGLTLLGIPHPFLFGFIASILTFIPYVGIIISSLLPITVSWITFNSIWYPIGVVLIFGIVQLLEGYVIFPFAVGSRLKINTLVILVVITLGGIIWGAAGMILFIPFVSIAKLIADKTKSLKTLSLLLSNGESNKNEDKEYP